MEIRGERIRRIVRLSVLLLAVALLGPVRPAAAESLDEAVAKADRTLISELKSLTKWAAGKRINRFRHDVFEMILKVDPDDRRARGVLQYKRRKKSGRWVQDREYRQPANWGTAALPKAEAKRQEALEAWRDALLHAVEQWCPETDPRREPLLDRVASLLPQDAKVNELRGLILYEDRWVLPDTATAIQARKEIASFLTRATPKVLERITPLEEAIKKGWSTAWESRTRKVLGTVPSEHGKEHLLAVELADLLCDRLLGSLPGPRVRIPTKCIFLSSQSEAEQMARSEPKWEASVQDLQRFRSCLLPGGVVLSYRTNPEEARSSCVRRLIQFGLYAAVGSHERGWITEGVGQRLTWYVLGYHGPNYISTEQTEAQRQAGSGGVLPHDDKRWNRAAARVLEKDGARRVVAVLTMRLNAMQPADVLVAYGLAAFLLETRPKQFLPFLKASAKRHDVDAIIQETLGADDAKMLTFHLQRWLEEN